MRKVDALDGRVLVDPRQSRRRRVTTAGLENGFRGRLKSLSHRFPAGEHVLSFGKKKPLPYIRASLGAYNEENSGNVGSSGGSGDSIHGGGDSDTRGGRRELQRATIVRCLPKHDFVSLVSRPAVPRRGQPQRVSDRGPSTVVRFGPRLF